MKNNHILYCFLLFIFISSCQDPSGIGSGVLGDDNIFIEKTSDFELRARTINSKPYPAYIRTVHNNFIVGSYEDTQFGTTEAQIYSTVLRNTFVTTPEFDGATIDSMVMVLSYDSTFIYGSSDAIFNFEVLEITKDLRDFDTLWSNTIIDVSPTVLGSNNVAFEPLKMVSILDYVSGDAVELDPQIRIPISLNHSIFTDANFVDDQAFADALKGVSIKANSLENDAMMMLLFGIASDGEEGQNGIHIYYTDKDGVKNEYRLLFSNRKFSQVNSGFADSANGSVLNSFEAGEELLYMQALDGPFIEIEFSDLKTKMAGNAINSAILELTIADVDNEDYNIFSPIDQLNGLYSTNSNLFSIRDIVIGNSSNLSISSIFGGELISDNGSMTYSINITNHIQDIFNGRKDNSLILSPYIRRGSAKRSLINGPKSALNPMKLSISYTEGR